MKITDIQAQKRSQTRMSLFVDGKYSFSLPLAEVQDQEIRIGRELTERELTNFKRMSEDSKVYELALAKSLRRPHSIREMRDYLRSKNIAPELTESIIERLTKLRYLDDTNFARFWIESRRRRHKSDRFIHGELRAKGVEQSIVDSQMSGGVENDMAALRSVVGKVAKRYDSEQKLVRYLLGKGFKYSDVKAVLTEQED